MMKHSIGVKNVYLFRTYFQLMIEMPGILLKIILSNDSNKINKTVFLENI